MGIRDRIVEVCEEWLPETGDLNAILHWNQLGFNHIAKDYGQGSGTTCGFLPHWLLWRLGCTDASLVNRSAPAQGLRYRIGENLLIFSKHASYVRVDGAISKRMAKSTLGDPTNGAAADPGPSPKPGDFIIVRGANWLTESTGKRDRDSAHICVLLDIVKSDGKRVTWRVAQTGMSTHGGEQGGHIATLTGTLTDGEVMDGTANVKGPSLVFTSNIRGESAAFPRRVTSFTDVDKVGFGPELNELLCGQFEQRRLEPAKNAPTLVYEWLGWFEETDPGGFIPLGPSYILLERGNEATKLQKRSAGAHAAADRGVWTRAGKRLDIQWCGGRRQSWDVVKSFVPRESTVGTPVTGDGGTLTRLKRMPPELPGWWANAHLPL